MRQSYQLWTKEEQDKLKILCDGKKPFTEIGKLLNRSGASCQGQARKLKYDNNYSYRKHFHNLNYWDAPNENNMFWAGFIAADGCLKDYNHYTLSIQLAATDLCMLEQFKKDIDYTGNFYFCKRLRNGKEYNHVKIDVNCDYWGNQLIKNFNITPRKSFRIAPPPNLKEELFFYWLKGYICGDGCIYLNPKTNQLMINITSGSEGMVKFIKEFTDKHFPFYIRKSKENPVKKRGNCYNYFISGVKACFLFDKLRGLNSPKMDRKWENPEVIKFVEENIKWYYEVKNKSLKNPPNPL